MTFTYGSVTPTSDRLRQPNDSQTMKASASAYSLGCYNYLLHRHQACKLSCEYDVGQLHVLWLTGLQPVLVHLSKNEHGEYSFNPVSINFLVEVVKTTFAILMLIVYVSLLILLCKATEDLAIMQAQTVCWLCWLWNGCCAELVQLTRMPCNWAHHTCSSVALSCLNVLVTCICCKLQDVTRDLVAPVSA